MPAKSASGVPEPPDFARLEEKGLDQDGLTFLKIWLRGQDLNLRPLGYENFSRVGVNRKLPKKGGVLAGRTGLEAARESNRLEGTGSP